LAAGKGVLICENREEAIEAIESVMVEKTLGDAGNTVVIEEFWMEWKQAHFAFGWKHIDSMSSSKDYKRIFDNDEGPNTGGMGTYSPNPFVTKSVGKNREENS
jgi:phosphoribosylamine--glycine ligase